MFAVVVTSVNPSFIILKWGVRCVNCTGVLARCDKVAHFCHHSVPSRL